MIQLQKTQTNIWPTSCSAPSRVVLIVFTMPDDIAANMSGGLSWTSSENKFKPAFSSSCAHSCNLAATHAFSTDGAAREVIEWIEKPGSFYSFYSNYSKYGTMIASVANNEDKLSLCLTPASNNMSVSDATQYVRILSSLEEVAKQRMKSNSAVGANYQFNRFLKCDQPNSWFAVLFLFSTIRNFEQIFFFTEFIRILQNFYRIAGRLQWRLYAQ